MLQQKQTHKAQGALLPHSARPAQIGLYHPLNIDDITDSVTIQIGASTRSASQRLADCYLHIDRIDNSVSVEIATARCHGAVLREYKRAARQRPRRSRDRDGSAVRPQCQRRRGLTLGIRIDHQLRHSSRERRNS